MKKKESKEVSQKTTVKKKASTKKQVKKYKSPTWKEVFDSHVLPPLPPVLPKLIETSISQTPELLKGTVAQAIPVAYSIYPRGLSFVYTDNRTRELRMNCLLVAHEGGGKECITLPVKHILAEVKATSKHDRQRLKEYNDKYNRARNDEEKPQRPTDLDIRWLFPDITRPRLGLAMEDAQNAFLFLKLNEFEDWDRVEGKQGRANSF